MNLVEKDLQYVWHPCSQMKDYETLPPIVVKRGSGVYLYGADGKEYIDIISSWWCNLFGHCNPEINEAVRKQLDQLEHVIFANFTHEGAILLCEQLAEVVPKGLGKFHFCDNGSAAVECALKMAFQYQYQTGRPKKQRFMCLTEGYHGETIGALSVGSMDLYAKIYRPLLMDAIQVKAPDCYRCEYGKSREDCNCECVQELERGMEHYAEETCAIILEPLLQGSAGMRMYPPLYLTKLRDLCDRYDVLWIADEIATGFGRTGKMFACDHAGVAPDILCLSKGLTGGYLPMSLTVTTDQVYDAFYADYNENKAFLHSHTYSGNPLGCAAALAVQRIFREKPILKQAKKRADYLGASLNAAFTGHPNVGEIRGLGLVHALELVEDKDSKTGFDSKRRIGYRIYQKALAHGLLLRPLGNVLYFNPPLTINEAEIDEAVRRCGKALREVLPGGGL